MLANIHGSACILPLAIVLSWVAILTTADTSTNLNGTDGTLSSDLVPIVTTTAFFEAATPDSVMDGLSGEGGVTDHYDANSPTESQLSELPTTIFDTIRPSTGETTQSTNSELVTTSKVYTTTQNVYTTTQNFPNATSSASDVTNHSPTSNTTLATLPAADEEEIDNVRREATNLRIALIVVGIIAGLGILCSIILMVCLIFKKRKQNKFQTELGIEMKRQNRQLKEEKWPEMSRISSTNDMDSESRVSGEETDPKRAPSPAGSSNVYLDPDYPNPGLTSFTSPGSTETNDHDTYITSDQDNEYYNQNAQNNEYYNENLQNNEVYNNIEDGINQIPSISRRKYFNTRPSASSEDTGIYSNCKNS